MKRIFLFALFILFALPTHAQNLTTVTASNIQDINGVKLASGQLCFLITDQNDAPISVQVGGGGQSLRRGYCTAVTNGAVTSFTVPNPANTQPSGIYYRITVKDSSSGLEVLRYTQAAFAGGTFNFDNYAPTFPTFVAPTTNATVGNLTINGNLSVTGAMSFTPSSLTASNVTINQAANGNDALFGKRATDTSPTGNFEHFRNFANTTDLWTVDVTGTLQAGTVPASRLSGTLNSAQLPNPSSSTLGGVQSFAAISHQWINSISTLGVPAASQPAAADLSNGTTGSGSVVLATSPSLTTPNIGAASGSTVTFVNQAAPANPSAGNIVLYGDSGTGNMACRTSSGGNCLPSTAPFVSGSTNPATTGILRVANGDTAIAFRNNANTADIVGLSKNTSDIVSVGGSAGITTLGPVTLGATDAGLSRTAAASIAVGNGTAGDSSGTLLATTVTLPSTGLIKIGSTLGISNFSSQFAFGNGTAGSTSASLLAGNAQLSFSSTSGADLGLGTLGVYTLGSNGVWAWTSGAANVSPDTGLSRTSAGVVALGNGTQGNTSGSLKALGITANTQTFVNQAAPANPAAGNIILYGDSGTGNLTCRNSTGGSCLTATAAAPFISGSANPATTGIMRVASGDTAIAFRNNANTADIVGLSKNTSDVVSVGGSAGITTSGPVTIGATDTGLSRTAAATIAVGNGTAGDSSGALKALALTSNTHTFVNQAAPANPAAGNIILYGDSGTGNLTCRNSSGGSCITATASAPLITGSANPATTGIVRVASGDTAIAFRNNANTADIAALTKNTSDVVAVGGSAGITTSGPLTIGATDAGLSRTAAATIAVGNGTAGDASGTLKVTALNNGGTLSLPASADTLVGRATTDTLTNKSIDAEAVGNTITLPFYVQIPAAGCNNATATANWDLPTSNAPVPTCLTGTNTQQATADFDHTVARTMQTQFLLPPGWTGNVDMDIDWLVASGGGSNTVKFTVATACSASGASFDPTFNTANTITSGTVGANNAINVTSQTAITMTGCSAGNVLHVKFGRDVTDTSTATVKVLNVAFTIRRAM